MALFKLIPLIEWDGLSIEELEIISPSRSRIKTVQSYLKGEQNVCDSSISGKMG